MGCFTMFKKAKKVRVVVTGTDHNSLRIGIDRFFRVYGRDIGKLRRCSLISRLLKIHSMTLLGLGSYICNVSLVSILLRQGADANEHAGNGLPPLLTLCSHDPRTYGQLEIASLLIKHKAEINQQNSRGETALQLACQHGLVHLVALLIDAGSDVNISDIKGNTPLSDTCKRASECLSNPDKRYQCRSYQQCESWLHITISLLKAGADPKQGTILPFAVMFYCHRTVQELIDLGMDVNMKDNFGRSPVEYISNRLIYTYTLMKILLENGADVSEASGAFKIWLIAGNCSEVNIDNIFHFLSYGATFSSQEMVQVVSKIYTTWFQQFGEIIDINHSRLVPWNLLLNAGFRPSVSALDSGLNEMSNVSRHSALRAIIHDTLIHPPTLADLCRMTVRSHLHRPIDENVHQLPLPNSLKEFLKFKEVRSTRHDLEINSDGSCKYHALKHDSDDSCKYHALKHDSDDSGKDRALKREANCRYLCY